MSIWAILNRTIMFFFLIAISSTIAQNRTTQPSILDKTTIQFRWSNDFIYNTDYYFTNGFEFEILSPLAKRNPINIFLIPSLDESLNRYGFTLVQNMFTPKEKFDVEKQLDGDRPFAAYLLVGFKNKSLNPEKQIAVISEIQFGVLGPAALGEETQDAIHNVTGNSANLNGWENQISNSVALNYMASIYKTLYSNCWFDIYAVGKGGLGIPYTFLQAEGGLRLGLFEKNPQGFEMFSQKKVMFFVFAEIFERLVGYNATLQGGLISKSTYTIENINHLIGGYRLGISFVYNLLKLELATTYNSPEFPGALSHKWGYVVIKVGF